MCSSVRREELGRPAGRLLSLRSRSPVRTGIAMLLLAIHLGGCFRYVPVGSPQPGTLVTIGITDRGRVELAESVGPGVRRISGQVRESSDDRLVMSITTVEFTDINVPVVMERERFEISRDFVSEVRERQLSRSRSILTGVLVAAGLVAASFIAIAGFGGDDPSDRVPPGNGGETQ